MNNQAGNTNHIIERNSRTFIAGKTGTGKTYLAERLLKGVNRLIVIDTKGNLKERFSLTPESKKAWKKFDSGDDIRIQVKSPLLPVEKFQEYFDGIFEKAYHAGNCIVYIDEVYGVTNGSRDLPTWLTALYTRGRELGVGVMCCSQRPRHIPLFCMSESENFFIFRLLLKEDTDRLGSFVGELSPVPNSDKHGFWFYNIDMDRPIYQKSLS